MKGKKGAEMTVGMLVTIVLSILVLAFVTIGFATGWSNLLEKIKTSIGGGTANVESLKTTCTYACQMQQKFEFCCVERTIKFEKDGKIQQIKGATCVNPLIAPDDCSLNCVGVLCGQVSTLIEAKTRCEQSLAGKTKYSSEYNQSCCSQQMYIEGGEDKTEKCIKILEMSNPQHPCVKVKCGNT